MPKQPDLIGSPAPPLTLPRIPDGQPYSIPIGQKPIAIFFFPAAGTTGCTIQACSLRDATVKNVVFKRHPELEVIGISADPTAKLSHFADQHNLPYPLLSDLDRKAREAYGVSKAFLGLVDGRETVFISKEGTITGRCKADVDVFAHARFVEQQLKLLEASGNK